MLYDITTIFLVRDYEHEIEELEIKVLSLAVFSLIWSRMECKGRALDGKFEVEKPQLN